MTQSSRSLSQQRFQIFTTKPKVFVMNPERMHDWLQLVGMATIVASLIFVGLQLRQSEHAAQSDMSQSTVAVGVEISALIAEHSDVWLKACSGEELSAPEQLIANNVYFRYLQDNFNSWSRSKSTGIGFMQPSFFTDAYAANIHRYPGFRQIALSWGDWAEQGVRVADNSFAEGYKEEVLRRLSELEKEEPNPDADLAWCGVR